MGMCLVKCLITRASRRCTLASKAGISVIPRRAGRLFEGKDDKRTPAFWTWNTLDKKNDQKNKNSVILEYMRLQNGSWGVGWIERKPEKRTRTDSNKKKRTKNNCETPNETRNPGDLRYVQDQSAYPIYVICPTGKWHCTLLRRYSSSSSPFEARNPSRKSASLDEDTLARDVPQGSDVGMKSQKSSHCEWLRLDGGREESRKKGNNKAPIQRTDHRSSLSLVLSKIERRIT